ncbi:MAG TPA: toxin TcdB middle/N-terminal domain-containing protein [Alphaproteobacteria bacterium]|nr:toxin TcdB middle/N-terminal domain-containing protein [Alphaproteobacteria bacterium]
MPTPGYYYSEEYFPPLIIYDINNNDWGVRFVDLNNDALVDIYEAHFSTVSIRINNGTGWFLTDMLPPLEAIDIDGFDNGLRFGDVNNDGFTDLVRSREGNSSVYLNDGDLTDGSIWNLSPDWVVPIDIVGAGIDDHGAYLIDVNNDGFDDLTYAYNGNRGVYINNGSKWIYNRTLPCDFINGTTDNSAIDNGARFADVNGDGWIDIVHSYYWSPANNNRSVYINNGTGWMRDDSWIIPFYFIMSNETDTGARFVDLNNDGLVDLVKYTEESDSLAYMNNGTGFLLDGNWAVPEFFMNDGKDVAVALVDVNGDGFADIVKSHYSGFFDQHTLLKNSTPPHLIKSIKTEYGGIITFNYTKSTYFNNTDPENFLSASGELAKQSLGFNVYVVNRISKNNTLNSTFNVLYDRIFNYSYGSYNTTKREFRGFGKISEYKNEGYNEKYFYQDYIRKGKEKSHIDYNSTGAIFFQKDTFYNYTELEGIFSLSLTNIVEYYYDGISNPVVENKSFHVNNHGNYEYIIDFGDTSYLGDEMYYVYTYAINNDPWIVDKIASITLNDSSRKIHETKYYYDNNGLGGVNIGDLTKIEEWNSNGNNTYTYYTYDGSGNKITKSDSLGNTEKYTYDSTGKYLISITNPLGHITYYNFNQTNGKMMYSESNNIRTYYEYDALGRIAKIIKPYDSHALPTTSFVYGLNGFAGEAITVKNKINSDRYGQVTYLYDGFGEIFQIKTRYDNTSSIIKNIFYDNNYRKYMEQETFLNISAGMSGVSNSSYFTRYEYDALGRLSRIVNRDNTSRNITYSQRNITFIDENSNTVIHILDAYGRVVKIIEYNSDPIIGLQAYITKYDYDGNGNIIKITDSLGNIYRYKYDSLNRKIFESHPDIGNWTYSYNITGNLVSISDPSRNNITILYDKLNRILSKRSSTTNITYVYDNEYQGTLSAIILNSNNTINYSYDKRFRIIREIQNISGIVFTNNILYDSSDKIISSDGLIYNYNTLDQLYSINNYVNASYNAKGLLANKTYILSGISTVYEYDLNHRITRINTTNVQDIRYAYDGSGNIISINDSTQARRYNMSYDGLNRLIRTNVSNSSTTSIYKYAYNPIGNIMKIVENNFSKKFIYTAFRPHAPSTIINGSSGIDIYEVSSIDTGSRNRTFHIYLVSDNGAALNGVNLTVDLGNGKLINYTGINITDYTLIIINTTYSNGGSYNLSFNATSNGIKDSEIEKIKFGIHADSLKLVLGETSYRTFQLDLRSNILENIANVYWNCSENINSTIFNMTNENSVINITLMNYIEHNYSIPGSKNFTCSVNSSDGSDTITLEFTIDSLIIEDYDLLYNNIARRVIGYYINNRYHDTSSNITMTGDNYTTLLTDLETNERLLVLAEFNFSNDSANDFIISVSDTSANDTVQLYRDSFYTEGASVKNYDRANKNYTTIIMMFDVLNNWNAGFVNWSVTTPAVSNSTFLENNETILVFIESNYTQGIFTPKINASVSSYVDSINDYFFAKPAKIDNLFTLNENLTNTINELIIKNNLESNQGIFWRLHTGIINVTSNQTLILNASEDMLVYIATNYSNSTIYKTTAYINSTQYNDTEYSVVII